MIYIYIYIESTLTSPLASLSEWGPVGDFLAVIEGDLPGAVGPA